MNVFKAIKKAFVTMVLSTGVTFGGCASYGMAEPKDSGYGEIDSGYDPPSCFLDGDCSRASSWYNYCKPGGVCGHVDKNDGGLDVGAAK
jgi:hypothetical protein